MRIAICEDEPAQARVLTRLVHSWARARLLDASVDVFHSAEALLFAWEDAGYDALLLDIQMPGLDGMETARRIRQSNDQVAIVFVTGFADYMAEGYDVAALHYLMKPVNEDKLFATLDRASAALDNAEPTLLLQADGQTVCLQQKDILYAEALAPLVRVATAGADYESRMNLGDLEKQLSPSLFARCHRSYVVGLAHVRRLTRTDVMLDNGQSVPLARRAYDAVHQAFIQYYKGVR